MDVEALERSARMFLGRHDFLSFAATDPDIATREAALDRDAERDSEGTMAFGLEPMGLDLIGKQGAIRTICSSTWESRQSENGELLIYRVRGNGFLHHMVRNLVGTMLDVGRGYMDIERIPAILSARSRAVAGPTAPAQGLFLHSVEYEEGGMGR